MTVKNRSTGVSRTVPTNEKGIYSVPNLSPGEYEVRVSNQGFSTELRSGIVLTIGAELSVDMQLKVGNVNETVQVTGAVPNVELSSSTISEVVDEHTIKELPLNGRDWTQLALLQPGVNHNMVQDNSPTNRNQRGNGAAMAISGGRPSENNYRLNGITINDYANAAPGSSLGVNLGVDAIQEFSVLTDTFQADTGRATGGVVNAVTKSGSNQIHGTGYEFFRSDRLDARNFFDTTSSPPPFRRNQFGGSAGGPIKKDKTFWFADYEGFRESLGVTTTSIVPSATARTGALSTGKVAVDSKVAPFLALYPLPDGPLFSGGDTGPYNFAGQRISNENFLTTKGDHRFSDNDSINGMYLYDNGTVNQPDEFNLKPFLSISKRQVVTLEETHVFTPSLINTARAGMSRTVASSGFVTSVYNPLLSDPTLGFLPGLDVGTITVTGLTEFTGGVGRQNGTAFWYTSFQGYDDLYWTHGIHSIKAGFAVERMRDNLDRGRLL